MGFTNLGDLIPRERDLSKVALIDLGGEQSPREFTFAAIDAMANGVARALGKRGLSRGDRVALLSANRAEYLAAYYGIMRAGFVAVPVNFKFPRETIHFIIRDAGAKLVFCDDARAADCPPELPVVVSARHCERSEAIQTALASALDCFVASLLAMTHGFETFLDPGPFAAIARQGRAGDVSLHIGIDRNPEGRGAVPSESHLGGGDAAGAGSRPPSLSDRRAALSHERAGAGQARLRGARHHRAAAAIRRPRLHRGDRAIPLHLAHRRAADDRHDAARARPDGAHRPLQRRIRAHGLGTGQQQPDGRAACSAAARRGDQRLRHHRGRAGGVWAASARPAAAGAFGRLSASEGGVASRRWRKPRCRIRACWR